MAKRGAEDLIGSMEVDAGAAGSDAQKEEEIVDSQIKVQLRAISAGKEESRATFHTVDVRNRNVESLRDETK